MATNLTLDSTKAFRDKLAAKNLPPYNIPGVYSPQITTPNYDTVLSDLAVAASNESLILNDPTVDSYASINTYSPDGGFIKNINAVNTVLITPNPNQGPYGANDTLMDKGYENSYTSLNTVLNLYLNPLILQGGPQSALYSLPDKPYVPQGLITGQKSQTYPNFTLTNIYSPYDVLLGNIPSLSQDSTLQQIGAKFLQESFQDTIASNTLTSLKNQTGIGGAFTNQTTAANILSGKQPLVQNNYKITTPLTDESPNAEFTSRLQSNYSPSSPIPGDYFQTVILNPGASSQLSGAFNNGTTGGGVFGPPNSSNQNSSQIFIDNTGVSTLGLLQNILNFNIYKPAYTYTTNNTSNTLGNSITNQLNGLQPSTYYVGSPQSDPGRVDSPPGDTPVNQFGIQTSAPVYGPEKLAILYEGTGFDPAFGLNRIALDDGGGLDGGFVWTSTYYQGNAGFLVDLTGAPTEVDPVFSQIRSRYDLDQSTNYIFTPGSILDTTQRIINSQPLNSRRYSHAGNAIDQVSKIFDDGYKLLTKGSQVISYVSAGGQGLYYGNQIGQEYCRVFAKDVPYYTYSDLQKSGGLLYSNPFSVLSSTYNLNIAPNSGPNSTNIQGGQVLKYMFSIENLAWRTSNRSGLSVSDLPVCEIGPNGGRVMWFPPYDLKFNESSTASWTPTEFLGRPEPVYTYKATNRTGTLSFKVIVDHPSVLNVIVDDVLANNQPSVVNSVISSFFAGCTTYDLYTLAQIYNTMPTSFLQQIQEKLNTNNLATDTQSALVGSIPLTQAQNQGNIPSTTNFSSFNGLGFYFDNNFPTGQNTTATTSPEPFDEYFDEYIANQQTYQQQTNNDPSVGSFFNNVIIDNFNTIDGDNGLVSSIYNYLNLNPQNQLTLKLTASASPPASTSYNANLSARRSDSIQQYLLNKSINGNTLTKYITNGQLTITEDNEGELTSVNPTSTQQGISFSSYNCTDNDTGTPSTIYSVSQMACRTVTFTITTSSSEAANIDSTNPVASTAPIIQTQNGLPQQNTSTIPQAQLVNSLTKKVLRNLLSECNYFDMIQVQDPFILDSMKQRIQFFDPAFHSMTPEGLNGRLTFLQQCVRPGDTIPTITSNGNLKTPDAFNTAFGSPPVLVLRIGDFINCKILCNSLNINYEPALDLNPEGIGVQPMIATVSMGIIIIGGMGLEKPIEQLQNALSFNYYANTEIYDERALTSNQQSTNNTTINATSYSNLVSNQTNTTSNQQPVQQATQGSNDSLGTMDTSITTPINTNLSLIESLTNNTSNTSITSGVTNYNILMNELLSNSNLYFNTVINKSQDIFTNYNYGILQLWTQQRLYTSGYFRQFTTPIGVQIFGSSYQAQNRMYQAFTDLLSDISGNTNTPIIKELIQNKFPNAIIRQIQTQLTSFVSNLKVGFFNTLFSDEQALIQVEENLISSIDSLNYIDTNNDGKINANGSYLVYDLTPISPITPNFSGVAMDFISFNNSVTNNIITANYVNSGNFTILYNGSPIQNKINPKTAYIITPSASFSNEQELRFFLLMSQVITDDNQKNALINLLVQSIVTLNCSQCTQVQINNLKQLLADALTNRQTLYNLENNLFNNILTDYRNNNTGFLNYAPFSSNLNYQYNFQTDLNPSNESATLLTNLLRNSTNSPGPGFNLKKTINIT